MQQPKIDIQELISLLKITPWKRTEENINILMQATQHLTFFIKYTQQYGESDIHKLCCQYMTHESIAAQNYVFKIYHSGDKFYIILKGKVSIWIKPKNEKNPDNLIQAAVLKEGASFGELALINNARRSASILCTEDCEFAILNKENFQKILLKKEKEQLENRILFMKQIPLFQGLSFDQLQDIVFASVFIYYKRGENVFVDYESCDYVYIVRDGTFTLQRQYSPCNESDINQVDDNHLDSKTAFNKFYNSIEQKKNNNVYLKIKQLEQNDIFGEEDILEKRKQRSFVVYCHSFTGQIAQISKEDFIKLFTENQHICFKILNIYDQKKALLKERIYKLRNTIQRFGSLMLTDRKLKKSIVKTIKDTNDPANQQILKLKQKQQPFSTTKYIYQSRSRKKEKSQDKSQSDSNELTQTLNKEMQKEEIPTRNNLQLNLKQQYKAYFQQVEEKNIDLVNPLLDQNNIKFTNEDYFSNKKQYTQKDHQVQSPLKNQPIFSIQVAPSNKSKIQRVYSDVLAQKLAGIKYVIFYLIQQKKIQLEKQITYEHFMDKRPEFKNYLDELKMVKTPKDMLSGMKSCNSSKNNILTKKRSLPQLKDNGYIKNLKNSSKQAYKNTSFMRNTKTRSLYILPSKQEN